MNPDGTKRLMKADRKPLLKKRKMSGIEAD